MPQSTNHVDSVLTHRGVVWDLTTKTNLLEEVGEIVGECVTSQILSGPKHTNDLGPAEIDTFEAVEVRCTRSDILFQFSSVSNHVEWFGSIKCGIGLGRSQSK